MTSIRGSDDAHEARAAKANLMVRKILINTFYVKGLPVSGLDNLCYYNVLI